MRLVFHYFFFGLFCLVKFVVGFGFGLRSGCASSGKQMRAFGGLDIGCGVLFLVKWDFSATACFS